ncbi:MAG: hypothetical protein AB3N23_15105 [Paracoccaceae bacterium]
MNEHDIEVFSLNMRVMWIFVVILGLAGAFLFVLPVIEGKTGDSEMVYSALFAAFVAWGAAALLGYYGYTRHGPVLTIGPTGLFDRRTMQRPVAWDEVQGISVSEVYMQGAFIRSIGLEFENTEGIDRREMGLVGADARAVLGISAVNVQVTGLRPSEQAAMAAFLRHLPERLQKDSNITL